MKKKYKIGPSTTIIALSIIVGLIGTIFSIFNIEGTVTNIENGVLSTSTITFQSLLTSKGVKYFFSNIVVNFKMYEPLVLLIISLIGVSICENSGLIKARMESLKKFKPTVITFLVLLLGFISSFLGNYAYIVFLPYVGVMYKYLNRNGALGVITLFIGVTVGHACGFIYNYDTYLLGEITTKAANIVDPSYVYSPSSTVYMMIISSVMFIFALTGIIMSKLEYRFDKPEKVQDELVVSKEGLKAVNLALLMIGIILIYLLVPGIYGSGILLDKTQNTYIAKLFSDAAPFKEGILFLFVLIMMISGLIYGKVSGNIKNSDDYNKGLSISFSKTGYVFVLLFFASILTSVLEYTNLHEMVCVSLVEFVGNLNFTGIMLIASLFVITILITLVFPSLLGKWLLMSPVIVPLFMKANISPGFTQFIFTAADSVGKLMTPFFAYFIVMIGFMQKHNDNNEKITLFKVIGMMSKIALLVIVIWVLIIIGWYIIGLPTGIKAYPTM